MERDVGEPGTHPERAVVPVAGPGVGARGRRRLLAWSQRGSLLMETVVVLGILVVLGTVLLGAVQTSYIAKRQFEVRSTADVLVRSQSEYVFEQPYQAPGGSYSTVATPAGFTIAADALVFDITSPNISTVQITVYHGGQPVKVFETLRANR